MLEIATARWAEGLAEGETKGETTGEIKAKVGAILAVLATRGVPVSQEVRARIEACKDVETLDRWIVRAVTATSAEEILSERG